MLAEFSVGKFLAQSCWSAAPGVNRGEAPLLQEAFFKMIGLIYGLVSAIY